jgi:hypothetical protein
MDSVIREIFLGSGFAVAVLMGLIASGVFGSRLKRLLAEADGQPQ